MKFPQNLPKSPYENLGQGNFDIKIKGRKCINLRPFITIFYFYDVPLPTKYF